MSKTASYHGFARKLEFGATFEIVECASCHMSFAMSTDFVAHLRASHENFYCPQGHSLSFHGETEVDRLKRQLDDARRNRDAAYTGMQAARDQAAAAERRRAAAKGQATKIKNRIAKGVCPCCNRSFVDLGKHMSNQHPEFAATDG